MTKSKHLGFLALFLFLFGGCFFSTKENLFRQGERAYQQERYKEAIRHFEKVVRRYSSDDLAIRAANQIANISLFHLKDFNKALKYNRHVVLSSSNEALRYEAQKRIAEITFENLSDHKQAIVEYNRLIDVAVHKEDLMDFRMHVAKSYFFLDQFFQAEMETNQLLATEPSEENRYELLLLKGNIDLATKNIDRAIEIYTGLLNEFPQQAAQDNVQLHLAVCYEEKKDFARAIEVLDNLRSEYGTPEFIDQRIDNLKKRQSHLPGAKGLRK